MRILFIVVVVAACLHPNANDCPGGGVCPVGLKCVMAPSGQVCVPPTCGNGIVDPGEACDDGNNVSGDECPLNCTHSCGDGVVDPGEDCDDGNNISGDGCPFDCSRHCGDGVLDPGEECDGSPGCSATCQVADHCGNRIVDADEECDDGNHSEQDGCSSTCELELPTWHTREVVSGRVMAAIAFDSARGRLVMFGGCASLNGTDCPGGPLDDTLEWDGVSWRTIAPASVSPPARIGGAMAFDARRERIVMFGGCPNRSLMPCNGLDDTWEWDGQTWTEVVLATNPSGRSFHSMSYDFVHHEVVLFGGCRTAFMMGLECEMPLDADTWTYDGTWHQRAQNQPGPSGRGLATLAFDFLRGDTVLFGGSTMRTGNTSFIGDTWGWNGSQWTPYVSSESPPVRAGHVSFFDPELGKLIVAGGCPDTTCTTTLHDTWAWDGSDWSAVVPNHPYYGSALTTAIYDVVRERGIVPVGNPDAFATHDVSIWSDLDWAGSGSNDDPDPPPRQDFALSYDPLRATTLLAGGTSQDSGDQSDTWTWDGLRWHSVTVLGPSGAGRSVYDGAHDRTVWFGANNETWLWDGASWQHTSGVHPTVTSFAMAFDRATETIVLFGNDAGASETWQWDGSTWRQNMTTANPSARSEMAMAFDPHTFDIVLFGGTSNGTFLDETWRWAGGSWMQAITSSNPSARAGAGMAYDARLQKVVLFGGLTATGESNETWTWDDAAWVRLPANDVPVGRHDHGMIYDAAARQIVMMGGRSSAFSSGFDANMYFFQYEGARGRDDVCTSSIDLDGDGLTGCTDPDCIGMCDPLCDTLGICADTRPICGDHVCSAMETCALCPVDCGICPPVCGDTLCTGGETCASCPGDCCQ
ncbi:MAG: DUF4215 domain-containing protein [Kofleriaceae bacterium]